MEFVHRAFRVLLRSGSIGSEVKARKFVARSRGTDSLAAYLRSVCICEAANSRKPLTMTIPFEPTRSYVYRATRYELLPQIQELAESFGDVPFRLRDSWRPLLAQTYTPEQLEIRVKKGTIRCDG